MESHIAVAIVHHEGNVLVGQRPDGVPLAGFWEFPGGKVEHSESPAEAAARECREEAGLQIRELRSFHQQRERYEHGPVRLHFFLCSAQQTNLPPRDPFRWVPLTELHRYRFPSGNHVVLKRLARLATQSPPGDIG